MEGDALVELLLSMLLAIVFDAPEQEVRPSVLIVVGAAGEEAYASQFREWAERWRAAAEKGKANVELIGLEAEGSTSDRDALQATIKKHETETKAELWIVLIGHGTFDGKVAKFNMRGADIAATELSNWLASLTRPIAFINCASCSSPFMTSLAGPNRVVITSTRAGAEHNFSRFGDYLSKSIADPAADLDKDEQTSLLEAFLAASAGVREFYASESRLATEHALLDDNADGKGTPSEWFQGLRAVKSAKEGALDGLVANQWRLVPSAREELLSPEARQRRDAIEKELAKLRASKSKQSENDYVKLIEPLLVELAKIYMAADEAAKNSAPAGATTPTVEPTREKPAP
jgi:hypothetical protein